MNVLTVLGNLGRDAEVKSIGGSSVANFSVAMTTGFGDRKQTIWLDCALWGKQAESGLINYLKKGQQVSVSGEMGTREHNGKTYITLRVNQISLAGGSQGQGQGQEPQQMQAAPQQQGNYSSAPNMGDMDDSIPF